MIETVPKLQFWNSNVSIVYKVFDEFAMSMHRRRVEDARFCRGALFRNGRVQFGKRFIFIRSGV
jgi:hypothetical protein